MVVAKNLCRHVPVDRSVPDDRYENSAVLKRNRGRMVKRSMLFNHLKRAKPTEESAPREPCQRISLLPGTETERELDAWFAGKRRWGESHRRVVEPGKHCGARLSQWVARPFYFWASRMYESSTTKVMLVSSRMAPRHFDILKASFNGTISRSTSDSIRFRYILKIVPAVVPDLAGLRWLG